MPELPEVETVCRQLEPELEGRRIERLEVLDERWCRPVPPAELEAAVAGATIEGLGRRGKYLLLALDGAQTLVMHLRMTGNLVLVEGEEQARPLRGEAAVRGRALDLRAPPARSLRPRRRPRGLVHRPAPLRRGLPDRRRRPRGPLRAARGRAALRRVHRRRRWARCAAGRTRAAEVVPARPVAGRRGRQHLRRRGALPRPPAPALARRLDEARAPRGAARRGRRGAGGGDRRRRRLDRRLPRRARREGHDAGRVPRPHPRGGALPALRRADRADRRLRPLDLLLPELPGAPAQRRAAVAVRPVVQPRTAWPERR